MVVEEVACLIGVELAIDVGLVLKKRILSIIAGNRYSYSDQGLIFDLREFVTKNSSSKILKTVVPRLTHGEKILTFM